MASLKISSFQSWNLTEQEILSGSILTTMNKCVIQNRIVEIAEEKLALTIEDPEKMAKYFQREAELQGQLLALNWLLHCSEAAESQFNQSYHHIQESRS